MVKTTKSCVRGDFLWLMFKPAPDVVVIVKQNMFHGKPLFVEQAVDKVLVHIFLGLWGITTGDLGIRGGSRRGEMREIYAEFGGFLKNYEEIGRISLKPYLGAWG